MYRIDLLCEMNKCSSSEFRYRLLFSFKNQLTSIYLFTHLFKIDDRSTQGPFKMSEIHRNAYNMHNAEK